MTSVLPLLETEQEVIVSTTGEILPAIDADHSTALQIEQWLHSAIDAVQNMDSIDELNQAEAMLAAVERRLKQLGKSAAEAQRVRIVTLQRIGQKLGDAKPGNPTGANQHTDRGMSQTSDIPTETKSPSVRNRDWQARKISENWDTIGPVVAGMANPSVNAVMREIKRRTAKIQEPPKGGAAIITNASWEQWLPAQEPCDILLTDPPYATDVDDISKFASHWLPYALAKVKPTGRAYVCVGAYPHELEAYLTIPTPEHINLQQVLVWTYRNTLGPTPKYDFFLNWQAILYYRGVDAPPIDSPEMLEQCAVIDLPHPTRSADRWHKWQKPDELAERLIRMSTQPGDTLLDPFAGSGTHLVAASRMGRKGMGCELDPETVAIAKQRGCRDAQG